MEELSIFLHNGPVEFKFYRRLVDSITGEKLFGQVDSTTAANEIIVKRVGGVDEEEDEKQHHMFL